MNGASKAIVTTVGGATGVILTAFTQLVTVAVLFLRD